MSIEVVCPRHFGVMQRLFIRHLRYSNRFFHYVPLTNNKNTTMYMGSNIEVETQHRQHVTHRKADTMILDVIKAFLAVALILVSSSVSDGNGNLSTVSEKYKILLF